MPRCLFVGRTRYRLPLGEGLARKWDALSERMEVRVVASGTGSDPRFHLLKPAPLDGPVFYAMLPGVVAGELRSFRPDVVIAESPYEAAAVEPALRLTRSLAKLVVEVHGDWHVWSHLYGSTHRARLAPLSDRLARRAVVRADGHRAVSDFTAGLVRAEGREPLGVFTTYSDLSAFSDAIVPVPGEQRVLFVGVLERYKNVEGLAAAWRLVRRRLPDAGLHLVGAGRMIDVAESLVREGATWDTRLEPRAVAGALDAARALILPSASEGLPRVAIEAFLRGRAVVGSRAGGIPDIVHDGENGLLIPFGDADALAFAIVNVLEDRGFAQRLGDGALASSGRWVSTPAEYADRVRAVVDAVLAAREP